MESIGKYFEGIAWKYLSGVDVSPHSPEGISSQHELGGLVKAGFKKFLGDPGSDISYFNAKFIYLNEDEDKTISSDSRVGWYDVRRHNPNRSPELRLYYMDNLVVSEMRQGDFFLIGKKRDDSLLIILAPCDSTEERQLRWLFGIEETDKKFSGKAIPLETFRESLIAKWILEEIDISPDLPQEKDLWLDLLVKQFGSVFPNTKIFSKTARDLSQVSLRDDSFDRVLVAWLETEESLFRIFERHLVEDRLKDGFKDVDDFISCSLSIQNRRKSRAGYSLENHLEVLLKNSKISFVRGKITENKSKPDFLFPGITEYKDPEFPVEQLVVLGAKSSCKERWRQVLAEANRVRNKHLVTLQPAISENQTNEMKANNLQLVLPQSVHATFSQDQQRWLWNIERFISFVQETQKDLQS